MNGRARVLGSKGARRRSIAALAALTGAFAFALVASSALAAVGGNVFLPNQDGSVCDTGFQMCTVDGRIESDFLLNSDSDCEWRIDINYGDGTVETGRLTNGGDEIGYPIVHTYEQRGSYTLTVQLSEGSSPSNFPPGCGGYRETCAVQYPKAPRKGDTEEFRGAVGEIKKRRETFTMSHAGPGPVLIAATRETDWRSGLGDFGDLGRGLAIEVRARFDGKRWVAERVKKHRLDGTSRACKYGTP
jgi:hypothetical protein